MSDHNEPIKELDVLVVGAGLSGITAAYRLQDQCPDLRFVVVEGRQAIGGTWDLFRYPGVRSDSDMYTFGFPFHPWSGENSMADGPSIKAYIEEVVESYNLDRYIRLGHRLLKADWRDAEEMWSFVLECDGEELEGRCRFLWLCTGYYNYEQGFHPELPGLDSFEGPVVHTQHWPTDLDYEGKKVLVIGSGATAVTLVPALAKRAEHVTMLQRSPGYVSEVSSHDPWAGILKRYLPFRWAAFLLRWKGILYQSLVFQLARRFPEFMRRVLLKPLRKLFGEEYVKKHFSPRYNPWEQRLCADADGEFLASLQEGRASVITDEIETFVADGVILKSGHKRACDLVVKATGLQLELFGKAHLTVNGQVLESSEHVVYKGTMLSSVPNLAFALGYTNMSWTLRCDLSARYICRLLKFMKERDYQVCRPRKAPPEELRKSLIDFSSGYFQRSASILPQQGKEAPWRLHQSYLHDLVQTGLAPIEDSVLEFH